MDPNCFEKLYLPTVSRCRRLLRDALRLAGRDRQQLGVHPLLPEEPGQRVRAKHAHQRRRRPSGSGQGQGVLLDPHRLEVLWQLARCRKDLPLRRGEFRVQIVQSMSASGSSSPESSLAHFALA